jgi:phosphate transport system substrate-binding protein
VFNYLLRQSPLLAAAALAIIGCQGNPGSAGTVVIKIAASDSSAPLARDLTEAFSQRHPGVQFDITSSSPRSCAALVAEGEAHLAVAPLVTPTVSGEMVVTPVARDGIAIVVHPENPIDTITLLELRDIYSGNVNSWQVVGGTGEQVQVITRGNACPSASQFQAVVLGDWQTTRTALVAPTAEAVVEMVSERPGAIGYVSACLTDERVKLVKLEGMLPDPETVASGLYHITLDFYAVHRMPAALEVSEFMQFVTSPAGQSIVGARCGSVR